MVYPGQNPLETDLLNTNKNAMMGLAKLAAAVLGTSTLINGFATTQTVVPSLSVSVAAGEIYSMQNVDGTSYSSLPADVAHQILKQGMQLDPVTLATPAPTTVGQSINYLIEVSYQDEDTGQVVLPYYNASNPSQAYSGPAGTGASQATMRQGAVVVQAKAGIAAPTGTQTTPAPDAGFVGAYVVTVAFGATTVVNANISQYPGAPFNASGGQRLINVQTFSVAGTTTYVPTPGTKSVIVEVLGGGGGGAGSPAATSAQVGIASGGGAGSYAQSRILANFAGVSVTVGSGGTAGAAGGVGGAGGQSSFGALVVAAGGNGGPGTLANGPPFIVAGNTGGALPTTGNMVNAAGQPSSFAISPNLSGFVSGAGAPSFFGGGGSSVVSMTGPGVAGVTAGSGGSGGATAPSGVAQVGGAGAAGIVIVHEYS